MVRWRPPRTAQHCAGLVIITVLRHVQCAYILLLANDDYITEPRLGMAPALHTCGRVVRYVPSFWSCFCTTAYPNALFLRPGRYTCGDNLHAVSRNIFLHRLAPRVAIARDGRRGALRMRHSSRRPVASRRPLKPAAVCLTPSKAESPPYPCTCPHAPRGIARGMFSG